MRVTARWFAPPELLAGLPGHLLTWWLALDHESGDRDLFIESSGHGAVDDPFPFQRRWIHDREDPQLEVNFGFFYK